MMITEDNINLNLQKRPTFLKILCIISFAMCALMILINGFMVIFSLLAEPKSADQIDPKNLMDQIMLAVAYSGTESLKNLIVELVSLAGIFLMWRLKKVGFYIYVIAESFIYFQFAYLMIIANADLHDAMLVGAEMIWPLPFDLAFFIMYATQLKHMTWKLKANDL